MLFLTIITGRFDDRFSHTLQNYKYSEEYTNNLQLFYPVLAEDLQHGLLDGVGPEEVTAVVGVGAVG